MFIRKHLVVLIVSFLAAGLFQIPALAQSQATGTVRGVVTLEDTGKPVHGVAVTILQLRRSVMTGDDGTYEFQNVPAGKYDIVARLDRVPDVVHTVEVTAGSTADVGFQIRLKRAEIQVMVTATGEEESSLKAVQPVTSLGATELADKNCQSLRDPRNREPRVHKPRPGRA